MTTFKLSTRNMKNSTTVNKLKPIPRPIEPPMVPIVISRYDYKLKFFIINRFHKWLRFIYRKRNKPINVRN